MATTEDVPVTCESCGNESTIEGFSKLIGVEPPATWKCEECDHENPSPRPGYRPDFIKGSKAPGPSDGEMRPCQIAGCAGTQTFVKHNLPPRETQTGTGDGASINLEKRGRQRGWHCDQNDEHYDGAAR